MKIVISGKPDSKARPRFGKRGRVYDPNKEKTKWVKSILRLYAKGGRLSGPVFVDFTFVFSRPKSHFRQGKFSHLLKDAAPNMHTFTPDIDNCIKFYLDAANEVLFLDDSQVCSVNATKRYVLEDEEEQTIIYFREVFSNGSTNKHDPE